MKILGIITALMTISAGFYGVTVFAYDLNIQVTSNTEAIQLQRWQKLNEKRKSEGLNPVERFEFCKLSQALRYNAEGCSRA